MPDWADFVPELVCLGVDLVIAGVLCKCYENANKVVRDLNSATQLTVDSGLKDCIRSHPEAVVDDVNETVTVPYVALRGVVTPLGKSVISLHPQQTMEGVIQRVVFTEHKKSRQQWGGVWVDTKRVLHQMTSHVPFCLTDSSEGGLFSAVKPFVEVLDWKEAARIDMETVHDEFESNNSSIGEHLWNHFVAGEVARGVQKTETMLINGSTITGVGRLVLGPMGVKLLPPEDGKSFFLVDSLKSLINEETNSRTFYKILVYTFGGLGVFFSGYIAWKYLNIAKREAAVREVIVHFSSLRLNSIFSRSAI